MQSLGILEDVRRRQEDQLPEERQWVLAGELRLPCQRSGRDQLLSHGRNAPFSALSISHYLGPQCFLETLVALSSAHDIHSPRRKKGPTRSRQCLGTEVIEVSILWAVGTQKLGEECSDPWGAYRAELHSSDFPCWAVQTQQASDLRQNSKSPLISVHAQFGCRLTISCM